jgi:hypothetical protein
MCVDVEMACAHCRRRPSRELIGDTRNDAAAVLKLKDQFLH